MTNLLIELQMASQVHMPTHEHISLCGQAAEEIERLQNAWASAVSRAVRAEADADRLFTIIMKEDIFMSYELEAALSLHRGAVKAR